MSTELWYKKQLRIVQTVLRETDIINYNARSVVEYLLKVRANCIVINAGGIVDFFHNPMELGNPNCFMTGENILKDLVEEAHKNEIRVIARVDFRGVEKHIYEQKPHWFAAKHDGGPVIHMGGLHGPCFNSLYMNEYASEFVRFLLKNFDVDGIWENALATIKGPCYCKTCRNLYKKDTGKEIPIHDDYASPVFEEYKYWKAGCAVRHLKLIRDTVKEHGEDKAYAAEIFGMFHVQNVFDSGIDLYYARNNFDFLVSPTFQTDKKKDRIYEDIGYSASNTRFMKALDPERQAVILYGNNGTRWRYVMDPQIETKIWLWEAVSAGAGFWNCMFIGQHPAATLDNRNAYIEKEAYTFLAEHEELLKTQVQKPDVGIYYSKPSRDLFAKDEEKTDGYGVFIKGVEGLLIEKHVQYTFCPDIDFCLDRIKHLKVLIIPNGACMPQIHIDTIMEYVKEGGGLVASYETSLYDEKGRSREDFGLKELFGCSFTGIKKDTEHDCYQMVREEHAILNGINNTSLLVNDGTTLLCVPLKNEGYKSICTYVPIIPNQPPEKAWIWDMKTEYPTVMAGHYGRGKVVYFSNQIDKLCYTNGHEDFTNIFFNAIDWVKSSAFTVDTNAPPSVHVTLTKNVENACECVLSLVNITSLPKRPIRNLTPVFDIKVKVVLEGRALKRHKVLRQEGEVRVEVLNAQENCVEVLIKIDKLSEFTSVYLESEKGGEA